MKFHNATMTDWDKFRSHVKKFSPIKWMRKIYKQILTIFFPYKLTNFLNLSFLKTKTKTVRKKNVVNWWNKEWNKAIKHRANMKN